MVLIKRYYSSCTYIQCNIHGYSTLKLFCVPGTINRLLESSRLLIDYLYAAVRTQTRNAILHLPSYAPYIINNTRTLLYSTTMYHSTLYYTQTYIKPHRLVPPPPPFHRLPRERKFFRGRDPSDKPQTHRGGSAFDGQHGGARLELLSIFFYHARR